MKNIKAVIILTFMSITGCAEPLTDAQVKALVEQCEKTGQSVYLFSNAFRSSGECVPVSELLDKILE
jgi:hypothetical protein